MAVSVSEWVRVSDKGNTTVALRLDKYKGQVIKISQKRRSGNGKLTMHGNLITYKEQV